MKVVVVGAGQMGSIYGAAAHKKGHEVWFIDAVPAIVEAINERGLIIDRRDGRRDVCMVPATLEPAEIAATADVVLFQTKGWATPAAAAAARPIIRPETVVVTLQNGLGNEEVIRQALPDATVMIGMSVHTVITVDIAHYSHTGVRDTQLGPADATQPGALEAAEKAATAFRSDTFPVEVLPEAEIRRAQWSKFVLNCGSLPVAALTRLRTDVLRDELLPFAVMDDLTRETCRIANAAGIELDAEERVAFQHELFATAGGRASMLGDVLAHRRTEIDTINGAALRYADRLGVPAPLNRVMFNLVKGLEKAIELGEA
jgi:2-dehydropantoate 2-reductase